MPERIQLRRTKGWRKPEGAVAVSRPGPWGNPYRIGGGCCAVACGDRPLRHWHIYENHRSTALEPRDRAEAAGWAVFYFRAALNAGALSFGAADVVVALAGCDLACWCPLDQPCHADVLLEIANRPAVG